MSVETTTSKQGFRFLGNQNSKELHDLTNTHTNCQVDEILTHGNGLKFGPDVMSFPLSNGFDPCHYCLEDQVGDVPTWTVKVPGETLKAWAGMPTTTKKDPDFSAVIAAVCGSTDETELVADYTGGQGPTAAVVQKAAKSVCQFRWKNASGLTKLFAEPGDVAGQTYGTGVLLMGNIIATASHLFLPAGLSNGYTVPRHAGGVLATPEELAVGMEVVFGNGTPGQPAEVLPVKSLLSYAPHNSDLAFVLVDPTSQTPAMLNTPTDVNKSDKAFVVGHGNGGPSQIAAGPIEWNSNTYNSLGYEIDTHGGTSGAGVFEEVTGDLVGIHATGSCKTQGVLANTGCNKSFLKSAWAEATIASANFQLGGGSAPSGVGDTQPVAGSSQIPLGVRYRFKAHDIKDTSPVDKDDVRLTYAHTRNGSPKTNPLGDTKMADKDVNTWVLFGSVNKLAGKTNFIAGDEIDLFAYEKDNPINKSNHTDTHTYKLAKTDQEYVSRNEPYGSASFRILETKHLPDIGGHPAREVVVQTWDYDHPNGLTVTLFVGWGVNADDRAFELKGKYCTWEISLEPDWY